MEKYPQGNSDEAREGYCKGACEMKPTKRVADNILPHILNLEKFEGLDQFFKYSTGSRPGLTIHKPITGTMADMVLHGFLNIALEPLVYLSVLIYASRATFKDFEIYVPHATFEDPLMCAHGVNQIKSAFYSLAKVFSESRIVDYSIKENIIAPGKTEVNEILSHLSLALILIDNKQFYKFLGRDIDVISLIKLYTENGKVIRHEDWWDKKPLWNRETVRVPLAGRIIEATRRASMLATHALMRFGKDPPM
ncbi:nuclear transport factor 2 family protein [Striga asiatica]|uniref:Nuclear transport factor 2 family protein n=1 Tax=Striga asiatica TaxID=4170 RepID=A0A5A7Q737_STRAF|nr:nuclear transport factor 2 family protein [Striga asiatica]